MGAMNLKNTISWLKALVFAGAMALSLVVFAAQRKVHIPTDNGLKLANGSTGVVTYNLTCFNSTGGTVFTSNGLTLSAKASTNYGNSSGSNSSFCSASSNMYTSYSSSMQTCGPYTQYSNASSSCGSGSHLCSVGEWYSNRGGGFWSGWVDASSFSGTWSYSTDYGSTWSNATLTTYKPGASPYQSNTVCASSSNGGGTTYSQCQPYDATGWSAPAYCCGGNSSNVTACDVTITSSGHLQSPQFKGNAPF